ncbi:hypothetical protein QTG56_22205 [Rossellomorea sp. AcN35-11]|nr:hypothetical protein [Rossellomorea aquimaris]NMH69372.1 hypothetical protein [Bacillus sp. RO3]WJV29591.1 hypothetical protein QTG56_22205 [Rossellomorea sp. AcN35-11]
MIGLLLAIILFNGIALAVKKRLTLNQMTHIWLFTIALQLLHDHYVELKYRGYWYFTPEIGWTDILTHTVLIPPVNVLFLNFFPFKKGKGKQILYITVWLALIIGYEMVASLPEPFGYFHYGWWKLQYSIVEDVLLLLILLGLYRYVTYLERRGQ